MWYKHENDRIVVNVYVQPGAKRNEVVGFYGDAVKIRLLSLPIDGRANNALLKFIADLFDVPQCQVAVIRGDKSRHKKNAIIGSKSDPVSILSGFL